MGTTWDGLPIAPDWPYGASVVVRRPDGAVLLLHRAHHGPDYHGPWGWTTPSGSRQPGESLMAAVARELAEEAGLTGLDVAPVDLTGSWVLLTAEIGARTPIVLTDAEHDRFAWVQPAEAYERVRPRFVADGVRRALAVSLEPLTFAALTRADLPHLVSWQNADHVRPWWPDAPADVDAAEAAYRTSVSVDVVLLAGRRIGFVESAPLAADEEYFETARWVTDGGDRAVTIDYAVGDASLVGRGVGTRMIWNYVRDVVPARYPGTRFVLADPVAANVASVRACEKAGFRRVFDFEPEPGGRRHALCLFEVDRVLGPRGYGLNVRAGT